MSPPCAQVAASFSILAIWGLAKSAEICEICGSFLFLLKSMGKLSSPFVNQCWTHVARGLFFPRVRIQSIDRERTAAPGGWILASNHISHFDPPTLSILSQRAVDWLAMEELFRGKITGALVRGMGAFPVKRGRPDRAALKAVLERLKAGRVVGIFPEGGLRAGPASVLEGAPIKGGISLLSVMANAPIRPCVLIGTDRLYRAKNWLPGPRVPVWAAFGEFIVPDPNVEKAEAIAKIETELSVAYRSLKAKLVTEFNLSANDLPQTPPHRKGEQH